MNLRDVASSMVPSNRVYVVKYVTKHWVGKPDPSGLGKYEVHYRDPSAAHEAATSLTLKGHKVTGICLGNTL
jgi:hypothetical protein